MESVGQLGHGPTWAGISAKYGVRPVINLKADTQFTGSGTVESPFEVVD